MCVGINYPRPKRDHVMLKEMLGNWTRYYYTSHLLAWLAVSHVDEPFNNNPTMCQTLDSM